MSKDDGIIGVSDHGGWAVLVTVAGDGTLLDRRRVELVDEDLPKIPHHSEGQALPLDEAVALVERVQASAERHAKLVLDAVAMTVPGAATNHCRADQGLPGAERRRLGDVPQGAGRSGRGARLGCPLVRREEGVCCGERGAGHRGH